MRRRATPVGNARVDVCKRLQRRSRNHPTTAVDIRSGTEAGAASSDLADGAAPAPASALLRRHPGIRPRRAHPGPTRPEPARPEPALSGPSSVLPPEIGTSTDRARRWVPSSG